MSKNLFPPSFGTPAFLPMPKGRGFSRAFGEFDAAICLCEGAF